jgi:hypothetical protein
MEEVGRETGNQGGGHDGAAGLNGTGNADRTLQICMDRMVKLLSEKLGVERPRRRNRYRPHHDRRSPNRQREISEKQV